MLSTILSLPIITTVVSCNIKNSNINVQIDNDNTEQITDIDNNVINKEEMKKINNTFTKIKALLSIQSNDESEFCKSSPITGPYVCGSDFTTSQSLADINVNKKIIEKIVKKIENLEKHSSDPINLKNIRFVPELKSVLFKANRENYVVKNEINLQVIYFKDNYQTSINFPLEIKGVHQDLKELIDQTIENLKTPVNFSKSFLLENDDLQFEKIEKEFLRLIIEQMDQDDERIEVKLGDKTQDLKNNEEIDIEITGKDDTKDITKNTKVKLQDLKTVDQFLKELNTNIEITRDHELYANIAGQTYEKTSLDERLFPLIKDRNADN